jgi:hypothetical protein
MNKSCTQTPVPQARIEPMSQCALGAGETLQRCETKLKLTSAISDRADDGLTNKPKLLAILHN